MKKLITIILGIFIGTISYSQVTIYQIQGQAASSPYEGQVVTTTGIVTGVYSNQGFVIQDGEGAWNGVYVYNPGNSQTVGNEIELTAMVSEYYGLTELTNPTGVTVLSVGNVLPQATVLSTAAINDEAYEGVLVMVDNASCTNPNLMYGEWEIDDGSGPCVVDDMGVVFTPDPGLQYAVTGPLFYSFGFYKIEPRSETDIEILNDLFFTTLPVQINPEKDTITLQWETNVAATTEIFFGLTPELELGHTSVPGMSTNHLLKWSLNVQPSMVYYIRPFSVAESDTTPDFTRSYATVSNSTGMVKLYFNHKVDHSVATITPAIWAPNIADTVTHYLNLAQYTLDITMYEQESEEIIAAINNAYNRGVQVRYITDDIGNNPALAELNPAIPVLYGNQNAIMHNKFIIIDTDLEMDCWVITGSLNHTHANLGWDYNNMICLQDQSLAKSFTLEFEEMWGGNGPDPDPAQAKFGAEKRDNTPHLFRIGDMPVELYFSPSDHTTGKIEKVINEAVNEFVFGMMVFTENSLGTAVKNAFDRGVEVTGIIDYVEYSGSEYGYLKSNGINVRNYVNPDGTSWP
nr:hypothetical protein [Bacteroidota bacterium]